MLQAIVTKYHGPTNYKGSRISARADAGRIVRLYDHALTLEENHAQAALDLMEEKGWMRPGRRLHGGGLPSNAGYCFVISEREG
jgi:hypothetical protein